MECAGSRPGDLRCRGGCFFARPHCPLAGVSRVVLAGDFNVSKSEADQSCWFVTEVQPHRPSLRAWLLARFPTLPDVDDVVQETFARVLGAREAGPIRSTRALLFAIARNLALDAVRRQQVVQVPGEGVVVVEEEDAHGGRRSVRRGNAINPQMVE